MFHQVDELSVALPLSLLACASRVLGDGEGSAVEVATVARSRFSVQTDGGLTLTPTWAFAGAPDHDALIVPGGGGVERARRDAAVQSYFASKVPAAATLLSVGSGALLLGEAGLLRGRRVAAPAWLHERLEDFEIVDVAATGLVQNPRIWCAGRPIDAVSGARALLQARFGADAAEGVMSAWDGPDAN